MITNYFAFSHLENQQLPNDMKLNAETQIFFQFAYSNYDYKLFCIFTMLQGTTEEDERQDLIAFSGIGPHSR